jgi:ATP-binding cassette subfamily B protein
MDRGAIVEQGTHDALLAARGFYFDLYNSQFAEPLAEAV